MPNWAIERPVIEKIPNMTTLPVGLGNWPDRVRAPADAINRRKSSVKIRRGVVKKETIPKNFLILNVSNHNFLDDITKIYLDFQMMIPRMIRQFYKQLKNQV